MSAPPAKRLNDLLRRKHGASVPMPRALLDEVLVAHEALVAEKAAADAELAAARVTLTYANALQRAVINPQTAAAAVTVESLRAYLRAAGWVTGVAEGYWQRGGWTTEVPPDEAMRDYAQRVLACAKEVGHAEGKPQVMVLATWLVAT